MTTQFAPMPIIVGVPRSGTTLLRMILDSHPWLAIPPETGFLCALVAPNGTGRSAADVLRILVESTNWIDFQMLEEELDAELSAVQPFSDADAIRCFYRMYAARHGKSWWGDKTPGYLLQMEAIEALLPEACFIHMIRDGRDVAVSLRRMWFSPAQDVELLAAHWRDQIRCGREQAKRVQHYVEIRYEDLVQDAPTIVRRLCSRLNLPWSSGMLRFYERSPTRLEEHEGRSDKDGRVFLTKAQRREQQIMTTRPMDAGRIGRWRSELSAEERVRFERVAGDLLVELGYL